MLCPKCGTENIDQVESCINCHERLLNKPQTNIDKDSQSNERIDQRETQTPDAERVIEKKPVVPMGLNIVIIIGTIIFPIIGIAMGYTYLKKDHPEARKAGKIWLILGMTMFLATIVLVSSTK